MKKVKNNSRVDDLLIDVIEYAFTEWLVRRGVFAAFKANYDFANPSRESFRDRLRSHIHLILDCSALSLDFLISTAFPFTRTPEGSDFWKSQSDAWECFCSKLKTRF